MNPSGGFQMMNSRLGSKLWIAVTNPFYWLKLKLTALVVDGATLLRGRDTGGPWGGLISYQCSFGS
jgi:hypothetical protein